MATELERLVVRIEADVAQLRGVSRGGPLSGVKRAWLVRGCQDRS